MFKRKPNVTQIGSDLRHTEVLPLTTFLVTILSVSSTLRKPLLELARRIVRLMRLSGYRGAARYMKLASLQFYKHLSGEGIIPFVPGEASPVAVAKDGLPLIIPGPLRKAIRDRDLKAVKLSLTVLSLYRTITFSGEVKFSSILDPGPRPVIGRELVALTETFFARSSIRWSGFHWRLLLTAGPNNRRSIYGAGMDAIAWVLRPRLLLTFKRILPSLTWWYLVILGLLATPLYIAKVIWEMADYLSVRLLRSLPTTWVYSFGRVNYRNRPDSVYFPGLPPTVREFLLSKIPRLGRLSVRVEPMGKRRVFAMPDWWTQMAMRPLHRNVFEFLSKIPQDGTHNQLSPLHRLLDIARLSNQKIYSLDLSSATDRFPVELQAELLAYFIGERKAEAWKRVLVNRYWEYRDEADVTHQLRYGQGQPMGAYSSWAVFALTHHLVVQLAAQRVGWKGWFPWYALLGDDLVILGDDVAKAYLSIMSQLGVKISAAKSLTSDRGVAEFAKHILSPYRDYSPIGAKACLASFREPLYMPALATDVKNKQYPIFAQDLMVGLAQTASHRRTARLKANHLKASLAIFGPSGAFPLPVGDWIAMRINPAGWRDWLAPQDSLSLAYALSSEGQRERNNWDDLRHMAVKAWWSGWPQFATGLPSSFSLLLPHFWIKSLEVLEVEELERPPFSTKELREKIRLGELITLEDMRSYYGGPELARPDVLAEAKGSPADNWITLSRTMCQKAYRLQRAYQRFRRSSTSPVSHPSKALVPYQGSDGGDWVIPTLSSDQYSLADDFLEEIAAIPIGGTYP